MKMKRPTVESAAQASTNTDSVSMAMVHILLEDLVAYLDLLALGMHHRHTS